MVLVVAVVHEIGTPLFRCAGTKAGKCENWMKERKERKEREERKEQERARCNRTSS